MHNAQQVKFTAKYFTIYTVLNPAALRENLTKATAPEETASDLEHPGVSWGLTDSEAESDLESKTDIKVTFTSVATRRDTPSSTKGEGFPGDWAGTKLLSSLALDANVYVVELSLWH